MTRRNWMALLGLLAVGALLAAGTADASWLTWGGDTNHSMTAAQPVSAPLAVEWKFAGAIPTKANESGMVIDGNTLYFGSSNVIYAVDAGTGELKWRQPEADSPAAGTNPKITGTPGVGHGMVFVPDQAGTVTAYDATDGTLRWEFRAGKTVQTAPLVLGNLVIFGSDDDHLYALNAANGSLVKKSAPLGEDISMQPAYQNGWLYVSSEAMQLWCVNTDTMTLRWSARVLGPTMNIAPVISGGKVFLANGSTIGTFRLGNGAPRPYPLQDLTADISVTPLITENYWYLADKNGTVYCRDKTGRKIWQLQLDGRAVGTPVLTPADRTGRQLLYVSTDKGFIYGIDPAKFDAKSGQGTFEWIYRSRPPRATGRSYYAFRTPLIADSGRLYALGDDGVLTCFSSAASDAEEPVIVAPRPGPGGAVNGAPPIQFQVSLWDEGSGINPNSIEVTIDGTPILPDDTRYDSKISKKRMGYVYDPVGQKLTWTFQSDADDVTGATSAEKRLMPGKHEIGVMVNDWKGNAKELKWTITADPSLPRPSVVKAQKKLQQGGPGAPGGMPGAAGRGMPGAAGGGMPGAAGGGMPGAAGGGMPGAAGGGMARPGGGYPGMGGGYPGMGGGMQRPGGGFRRR